jgi:hypothetical protein
MDIKHVPQDHISTYADNKKAVYATDEKGRYGVIASSGWDVEEAATKQALDELQRQADAAYAEVKEGKKSTLYYHMYAQRMDPVVLAQSVGMFQWRVKRHFKPAVFAKLPEKVLARYSEALGVTAEDLKKLPPKES